MSSCQNYHFFPFSWSFWQIFPMFSTKILTYCTVIVFLTPPIAAAPLFTLHLNAQLRYLSRPVCSDWSAVTGLSRHRPLCFLHQLCQCLCTHGTTGNMAEGCDCTVVTVQLWHHNLTDVRLVRLNTLNRGCVHFSVDWVTLLLSQYLYNTQTCFVIRETRSFSFYNNGPLKIKLKRATLKPNILAAEHKRL